MRISADNSFKGYRHLANRTTARERGSYHLAESYVLKEEPVPYGSLHLPESDVFGKEFRALPPAEEMVLVAWYENTAQLELAQAGDGFTYVRLGRRAGALHVLPNLAGVRRVVMRTEDGVVAPGFLKLREVGFRVFTRTQLRAELQAHVKGKGVAAWEASAAKDDEDDLENIYALFRTTMEPTSAGQTWRGDELMAQIERFESDLKNKPVENLGRTSSYARIVPLRDMLKACG